jgi:hypothetical protein
MFGDKDHGDDHPAYNIDDLTDDDDYGEEDDNQGAEG